MRLVGGLGSGPERFSGGRPRLPRIAIPLAHGDADVVLPLGKAFARCWESGPCPELLRHDDQPPGDLNAEDQAWCRESVG